MSTDRRWYEPPTPRDWRRPSATELQRLQSSMSLRKAILDRTTSSTPISKTLDRTSLSTSSSSSGRSVIPEVNKSLLERNLQEFVSKELLNDPLKRPIRLPAGRDSRPASLRRNQSLANLNASYILKNWHGTDVFESVVTTPSRPRSSSMTKYAPLPSITSAKNPEYQPPPLIRSRTFDVIDTKMKNLPTVDDSQVNHGQESEKENELEPPLLVTASIEGKTLSEYLSHARDGLLRSRPATRYGRSELFKSFGENYPVGVAWASEGTSLNPFQFSVSKHNKESLFYPSYNDSLLVVRTSSDWNLAALLGAVGGMRMGGRRLQVMLDGVHERDLSTGIQDLGIVHNTTVYLLHAG
ncbi:hypothetical protein E2C01_072590 [Portunus trituberculatus]|uniref:Uncharacterized protein n=1 Tax=Portunus trituberculatus TaxID=210409 RepID=A0A5B7I2Z2_PORTR|nr:hypothetical protein [Portunus trituberculatus]